MSHLTSLHFLCQQHFHTIQKEKALTTVKLPERYNVTFYYLGVINIPARFSLSLTA
jgi:hypothetical protein